jgi:hypothetical protein
MRHFLPCFGDVQVSTPCNLTPSRCLESHAGSGVEVNISNSIIEEIFMPKTSQVFLLCGVLTLPFLGSSSAHAATIVNAFGLCLDDQSGATQDRNPIVARRCFGLFEQQWQLNGSSIMGIGTGETGDPGQPNHSKCLTIFSTAEGATVLLVECQRVLRNPQTPELELLQRPNPQPIKRPVPHPQRNPGHAGDAPNLQWQLRPILVNPVLSIAL